MPPEATAVMTAEQWVVTPTPSEVEASPRRAELLRVDGLSITVGSQHLTAVREVSLRIEQGQALGLVGESGSGKTLTCRAILGALAPGCSVASGEISLGGESLIGLSARAWQDIHGNHLAAVFQDPASYLNPSLTVGRQLSEVLRVKLGLSRRDAHRRAIELFDSVELSDPARVYDQYPAELSGGMIQRVAIAIALSCDLDLLIADEATTALDVTVQAEILDLLAALRRDRGLSILLVSHDLGVISEVCDSVVVFYGGEVVESGPVEQILNNPRHPYTQALVRVAAGGGAADPFPTIEGQPPTVAEAIRGCRFAARCEFAAAGCRTSAVSLRSIADDHVVRCVRADELGPHLVSRPT
jgi:peptide/nickel transport system ATP-binding protein